MLLDDFLKSINMHPEQTDIDKTAESILSEMNRGLKGEASSIQMIPTFISAEGKAPENAPVIAIDAGGTNLRVGLVTFSDGEPRLSRFEKCPVPGSYGSILAADFFSELADKILPLTAESDTIGFCFSYPAEIFPNRDGRILQLNKELSVSGAEGKIIGEELIRKLKDAGVSKPLRFTLLNDTVAGLMGGLATLRLSHCDGLAGLILGTGYNTCYIERGARIEKLCSSHDMIINCESGIFNKALRGRSDELVDAANAIPNDHWLEKMLSGAYHGGVISRTAALAQNAGLLSEAFKEGFKEFTTPELDDFLRGADNRVSKMCVGDDRELLTAIIDRSFERAARLVCANILALCLQVDGGKSEARPFCVVAEGSTFHNSLLFKSKLERLLNDHVKEKRSRHIISVQAENSTMAGTALAALLN